MHVASLFLPIVFFLNHQNEDSFENKQKKLGVSEVRVRINIIWGFQTVVQVKSCIRQL